MSICYLNQIIFDPKELSAEQFQQLAAAIKRDDQGLGSIDFNKIIPAPPELNIEASTRTYQGLNLYRKYLRECSRLSKVKNYAPESYPRIKAEHDKKWSNIQKTESEIWELGVCAYKNKKRFGYLTQTEWNGVYWGTHRNAFDAQLIQDDSRTLTFYTSIASVPNVMLQLSSQYPELTMIYRWTSQEMEAEAGVYVLKAGEIVDENILETGSQEANEMANQILNFQGGNPMSNEPENKVVREITTDDLRHMDGQQEGLILQGCGGPPQEWVDDINDLLTEAGILLDGSKFENMSVFQHDGLTNLLFPFEDVKLDMGRLAMWRIQTHGQFGGTWLSDYVPNRLGGFVQKQIPQKPRMELIGHDGNIFSIMGRASFLLQMAGMDAENKEMVDRVTSCEDYNKALNIISEYVETELSSPAIPQKSTKKKARNTHER